MQIRCETSRNTIIIAICQSSTICDPRSVAILGRKCKAGVFSLPDSDFELASAVSIIYFNSFVTPPVAGLTDSLWVNAEIELAQVSIMCWQIK